MTRGTLSFSNHFCHCSQQWLMKMKQMSMVKREILFKSHWVWLFVVIYLFYSICLEMLLETSTHSTIERHIHNVLRKNFLEQRSITWKPIKVELIVNTQLTDDFFGKYISAKQNKNSMFSLSLSRYQKWISKKKKYFSSSSSLPTLNWSVKIILVVKIYPNTNLILFFLFACLLSVEEMYIFFLPNN